MHDQVCQRLVQWLSASYQGISARIPNCTWRRIAALLALCFASSQVGLAQTITKLNNANTLSSGTSWSGGNAPNSGSIAYWDNSSGSGTWSLGADVTWGRLTIGNVTGAGTISAGNTMTLTGLGGIGIDMSGAAANWNLLCNVVLGNSQTFSIAASRTLTVGGSISGGYAITKDGTGTLTLSNTANTFSGGMTINASSGTVIANTGSGTNKSGLGAGAVSIGSSSTLNLWSLNTASAATAINNTFTGTGLLKVTFHTTSASGTTLGGINGFQGTIELANDQANGDKLSGAINTLAALQIDSGSTLYVDNVQTFSSISVTGTGNNEGRGAIRLQNTLNGNITIIGGSATINGTGGTVNGSISSGTSGAQVLTLGSTGATTGLFNGIIGGGLGTIAVNNAAGVSTFAGVNTFTGGMTLTGGTAAGTVTSNFGAASSTITFNNGTLRILGTTLTSISGLGHTVVFAATKTVGLDINNSANTFTVDQVLNQTTGGLTKSGSGTLVLNQANTYSGATAISAGILSVSTINSVTGGSATSNLGTPSSAANGTIKIASGTTGATLLYTGSGETTDRAISLNGTTGATTLDQSGTTGLLKFTTALTASSYHNTSLILQGSNTGTAEFAGIISNLSATGSGNINGTFTSGSGTMTVASTTGLTIGAGVSAGTSITAGTTITAIGTGTITLSAVTTGAGSNVGVTFTGGIVSVTKSGTGTWTLSGNNSFTGGLTLNAGVLRLGNANALGSGTFTIGGSGTFDNTTGSPITVNNPFALSGGSPVFIGSSDMSIGGTVTISGIAAGNNRTVTVNSNTLSLTGNVSDGGIGLGLTKDGNGTLVLTGNNSYAKTTVNGGVLRAGSATAISSGALTMGGGTLQLNGNSFSVSTASGNGTIENANASAGTLTINQSAANTLSAIIRDGTGGGALSLVKSGASTLTLSGNNSFTGITTISQGILAITSDNALGDTTGNTVITATGSTTTGGQLQLSGNINSAENITITGTTEAANFLAAIQNTSNNNTLSGAITLSGTQAIRLSASAGTLNLNGSIARDGSNSGALYLGTSTGAAINVNQSINLNGGQLWIIGTGTVTLNPSSSNIGTTIIGAGNSGSAGPTLKLGIDNAVAQNQNLQLGFASANNDIATFDMAGHSQTVSALVGNVGTANSTYRLITNSAAGSLSTLTVGNGGGNGTYDGNIKDGSGTIAFVKTGSGTQTLTFSAGSNNFSGGATITAGTVNVGANNALSTGTLTFASSTGTLQASANVSLGNTTITLSGVQAYMDVASGNTMSLTGAIGGNGSLTKVSSGTLTLSGNNTYTGLTTISGGTLVLSGTSTTSGITIGGGTGTTLLVTKAGATGSGVINMNTGATTPNLQFHIDGGGNINLANALGGNSGITTTIDVNNNGSGLNGVIRLNGSMGSSAIGNATFNITGGNGYSLYIANLRDTAGSAGNMTLNPTTANVELGNLSSGTSGIKTWVLDGTSSGNSVSGTISDGASGTSAVTKSNSSTWTLSGNNSYTGLTTISGGYLVAASNSALGTTTGATSVSSGAALVLANGVVVTGESVTINGFGQNARGALQANASATAEWAGPILIGATADSRIGAQANGTLKVSGNISDGAGTILIISADATNGKVILSGAGNTYSGGTSIVRGTLQLGANNTLPTATLLDVHSASLVPDGAIFDMNGFNQTVSGIRRGSISGPATITNSAVGTLSTLTIGNNTTGYTFDSPITGNLAIIKTGSNTQTLSGNNSFSGGLSNNGTGAIILAHSNAAGGGTIYLQSMQTGTGMTLGLTGGINVANAIVMDSTAGRESINSMNGNNTLIGGITITGSGSSHLKIESITAGNTFTVTGGISGASYTGGVSLRGGAGATGYLSGIVNLNSELQHNGTANWTLNTAGSSYTATAILATGNFILGATDALATGARIRWGGSTVTGSLDMNGYNQTVTGLDLASTTVNPSVFNSQAGTLSTLTIGNSSGNDYTYAGTIGNTGSDNIALIKTGSNTQTLRGNNTYTGVTLINGGTLALSGSGSIINSVLIDVAASATFDVSGVSGYTLGNGQTLQGSGTVVGPVTASGTVAPGNGVGTLTFSSDFTLANNGTLSLELSGNNMDQIVVGGNLTLSGTINFAATGTQTSPAYVFATYGGSLNHAGVTVTGLPSGYTVNWAYAANEAAIVIPEPSALLLVGVGLVGLMLTSRWFRRRNA